MEEVPNLAQFFRVKGRFSRSVNVVSDLEDPEALCDYIVTPLTLNVVRRVGEGLRPRSRSRAWSITGPYGTGKSACALFLMRILGYPQDSSARHQLSVASPDAYEALFSDIPGLSDGGFFVVASIGSREPIAPAILRSLSRSLSSGVLRGQEVDQLIGWLNATYQQALVGDFIGSSTICEAIERTACAVRRASDKAIGLLIVLDELGKFLEHAALHPAQGDVFLLQAIAELAARSSEYPVGVVAILHQSFESYASKLSSTEQREWAKVQGRFENITFLDSQGELLKLVGQAIDRVPDNALDALVRAEVTQAGELGIVPSELSQRGSTILLERCAPLHPTVALVLAKLFRSRLAQNERSLFAFLTSGEPQSFQDYLMRERWQDDGRRPFYRLDVLYDYVYGAMGSALYAQMQGKRWAEIEDALERLPSDSLTLEARLIKAIGLLGLLGDQAYLKASEAVLIYALADGTEVGPSIVREALSSLRDKGLVVFRRHKAAYGLWEGSDIDLEEQYRRGLDHVDTSSSLASLLNKHVTPRPYVAKRHLHETGTLRYFVPRIVNLDGLSEIIEKPFYPADGAIVFIIDDGSSLEDVVKAVVHSSVRLEGPPKDLMLFAVPKEVWGLREAVNDVMAWDWVAENTPGLDGDNTARRELAGRRIEAQERLNRLTSRTFDKSSCYYTAVWVWAGSQRFFNRPADLSAALSEACDRAFSSAPLVLNELVNRRSLSSAAAAARRTLIERMLLSGGEERLGIVGFPPELSMYRSVLERTGIHHVARDGWEFGPSTDDPCGVRRLWDGLAAFLDTTEREKKLVPDLFRFFREPPYGVKDGLHPILLVAALSAWDSELAVYEDGRFIRQLDIAAVERLMKAPEHFSIQRYRLDEARHHLFQQFASLLSTKVEPLAAPTVVAAVRPILAFIHYIPPYTRVTDSISLEARKVRDAIVAAREPYRLLLEDIPRALGRQPVELGTDGTAIDGLFHDLKEVLSELSGAYERLLTMIQDQLFVAMRLPSDFGAAREEASQRGQGLVEWVTDLQLKGFVRRLMDAQLRRQEWLESIASCVTGKPPKQWVDQDLQGFNVALAQITAQFRRVEAIVAEQKLVSREEGRARIIRLGITAGSGDEQQAAIRILPEEEPDLYTVVNTLGEMLHRLAGSERMKVAAIAELSRRILSQAPGSSNGKDRE